MDLWWKLWLPVGQLSQAEGGNETNFCPLCKGCEYRIQPDPAGKHNLK